MAGNSTFSSLFTPIADAKKLVNRTVNLFAKISEVGLSQRSKGTGSFSPFSKPHHFLGEFENWGFWLPQSSDLSDGMVELGLKP